MTDLLGALRQAQTLEARGVVEVTVLFPPRQLPSKAAKALPRVPFHLGLIPRNFGVSRAGTENVAGRPTTRFELTPKVGLAARWTLWIDQRWNIPLAYQESFPDSTLARRATFQKVNAAPVKVQNLPPTLPQGLRPALLAALPGLRLPAGVQPVGIRNRANGGLELSLSDGINVFALVTAPRGVRAAPGIASRKVGGGFVWLVGNLPQSALDAALAKVRQVNTAGLGTFLTVDASNPQNDPKSQKETTP
ncbi:transcriptional regulator [Deinococcus arenicola]|uniref:Transcriptional regulator n=1 Tax=Deinococcus arenicola TaxID=2994950 RepID=A0ABU4DTX5_9DEIO|nr:transcriptional regulator [Deinococcus sp. ZS9-10]MDV6375873.1 transcriptional regulator [Deinococcus sp. ZS9-10]